MSKLQCLSGESIPPKTPCDNSYSSPNYYIFRIVLFKAELQVWFVLHGYIGAPWVACLRGMDAIRRIPCIFLTFFDLVR